MSTGATDGSLLCVGLHAACNGIADGSLLRMGLQTTCKGKAGMAQPDEVLSTEPWRRSRSTSRIGDVGESLGAVPCK